MYSRKKSDVNYKPTLFREVKSSTHNRSSRQSFERRERSDTSSKGFMQSPIMMSSPEASHLQTRKLNRRKSQLPYFVDRKLVPRVNEFLTNHHQVNSSRKPSLESAVDYLQYTYPEYGRKKRSSLRHSVQKVLKSLSRKSQLDESKLLDIENRHLQKQRKKVEDDASSGSDVEQSRISGSDSEFSIDEGEPLMEVQDTNFINNSMHAMYSRVSRGSSTAPPPTQLVPDLLRQPALPLGPQRSDELLSSMPLSVSEQSITVSSETVATVAQLGNQETVAVPPSENQESNEHEQTHAILQPFSEMLHSSSIKTEFVTSPAKNELMESVRSDNDGKIDNSRRSDDMSQRQSRLSKRKRFRSKQADEGNEKPKIEPTKSNVTFNDIGGCEGCLEEVVKLLLHLKHPEVFQQLGVKPPRGFLLHGPPGCGKTLLANAIAGELQLPFFKVAATEIVSGVSGESEQKLRELFTVALASAPSILFIDEIDSITPKRETASKEMERRIVAQLLTCMDDLADEDTHVLVIGATNRPDSLDPALRRAGRFDREISMGIPDRAARSRILQVVCRDLRLSADFDFDYVASLTPGFVGADLTALTREAAMCAVNRVFQRFQNETKAALSSMLQRPQENLSPDMEVTEEQSQVSHSSLALIRDQPPLQPEELEALAIELNDFEADSCETKFRKNSHKEEIWEDVCSNIYYVVSFNEESNKSN